MPACFRTATVRRLAPWLLTLACTFAAAVLVAAFCLGPSSAKSPTVSGTQASTSFTSFRTLGAG
ncbi:MAG: hypothetical protein AAGM22_28775 [Acidobacteriota bacterium]